MINPEPQAVPHPSYPARPEHRHQRLNLLRAEVGSGGPHLLQLQLRSRHTPPPAAAALSALPCRHRCLCCRHRRHQHRRAPPPRLPRASLRGQRRSEIRNRRPSHVGHVQPGASADDVGSRGGSGVPTSPPAQRGDASPIPFAATKRPRHKGYQGRRLLPAWGSLFDSLPPGLHQQRSRGHVGSIVHSVDRHGRGRRSSCYRRRLRCRKPRKRQRRRRHPALMQPPEDNRAGDVEEDPQRAQAPRASCRGTHQHYQRQRHGQQEA
mmetsp:Transcript_9557/g.23586  ORF Transcript_9557/g.23586 Transcript_9557/m.23586 type:complete len:265 (+) Transcript_9557:436-1230(+)